jgi:hypothetical protein
MNKKIIVWIAVLLFFIVPIAYGLDSTSTNLTKGCIWRAYTLDNTANENISADNGAANGGCSFAAGRPTGMSGSYHLTCDGAGGSHFDTNFGAGEWGNRDTWSIYFWSRSDSYDDMDAFFGAIDTAGNGRDGLTMMYESDDSGFTTQIGDVGSTPYWIFNDGAPVQKLDTAQWISHVYVQTCHTDKNDCFFPYYNGTLDQTWTEVADGTLDNDQLAIDFALLAQADDDDADDIIREMQGDMVEWIVFNCTLGQTDITALHDDKMTYTDILAYTGGTAPVITLDYPDNNTVYNLGGGDYGFRGFVNVTCDVACDVIINDSRWAVNFTGDQNVSFYNTNYLSLTDGWIDLNLTANNSNGETSSLITFRINTESPSIASDVDNSSYLGGSGNFTAQINATDDHQIFLLNISLNGVSYENRSGLSGTTYSHNISVTNTNLTALGLNYGVINVSAAACDAHTNLMIADMDVIKSKDQITFNGISIKSKDSTKSTEYSKALDRYSFSFVYHTPKYEIQIQLPPSCVRVLKSDYLGHYVCDNKYWVDFEGDHTVTTKGNLVTVRTDKPKARFDFNSIGELNCKNQELGHFTWYNENVSDYKANTIEGIGNTFRLEFEGLGASDTTTANLYYNNTFYEATKVGNVYTRGVSAPLLNVNSTNVTFYWNYTINDVPYNSTHQNQSVYMMVIDNCILNNAHALNISFQNQTNEGITTTLDITFDIWKDRSIKIRNYSYTVTGENATFCIYPDWAWYYADSSMEYTSVGYGTKNYYLNDVNLSNSTTNLILYQDSGATNITAIVWDETNQQLEGADIKVMKYDLGTNSYTLTEIARTNFEGQTVLHLIKNTQFYKFIIEYGGIVRKITNPTYIYEDSIDFNIATGDAVAQHYYKSQSITYTLEFNNNTNNFRLDYTDSQNVLSRICLKVEKILTSGKSLIGDTCLTTSTGTILQTITDLSGTYKATAYVGMSPEDYFLDSKMVSFIDEVKTGNLGLILLGFCTVLFGFIGWAVGGVPAALIITPIPSLVGSLVGLAAIKKEFTIPIFILALILAYLVSDRT